jgi:tellurite resistance protein
MSKPDKATKPTNEKTIEELEKFAETIRSELKVPRQSDLFRAAVEAGYLTAQADGEVDDTERATLVRAVEILSVGAVIEWEVETLVDACVSRIESEGASVRCEKVGTELKDLGQAEAGILIAAIVARATKKIEKSEAEVLKAVGRSAGLSNDQVATIVKRATALL